MILTIGSLYAGIGGIEEGFIRAGFKVLWANENDKNAVITYKNNFKHKLFTNDIYDDKFISELEPVDVLTAGFPCQPFSIAGYRKGFEDNRGNHFFRIMQIVNILKPKVLLLENVKNFYTHDKGNTYKIIKKTLLKHNYSFKDKIMNTMAYGNLPQNRERFYAVCFRDEESGKNKYINTFEFPSKIKLTKSIHNIISKEKIDEKYFYRNDKYMISHLEDVVKNANTIYQWRRVYVRENKNNVCPTLTANMGTGGHNVPIIKTKYGIRKLTPFECFKFQGYDNIKLPQLADSHLYKQAGNSVSVPVVTRIAKNIFKLLYEVK